jgi:DNA-binding beta-propeller fold protein YncE
MEQPEKGQTELKVILFHQHRFTIRLARRFENLTSMAAFAILLSFMMSIVYAQGATTLVASGLASPWGIIVDPTGSWLYVCEHYGGRVKKISLTGGNDTVIASGLSQPIGITMDSNSTWLYVTEWSGGRVIKMKVDGSSKTTIASSAVGVSSPYEIAIDPTDTWLYVCSNGATRVLKMSTDGQNVTVIRSGTMPMEFL